MAISDPRTMSRTPASVPTSQSIASADFCRKLVKAELHLHLEGSLEPRTLLAINRDLTPGQIAEKYQYEDFAGFLQSYIWASKQLSEPVHYALALERLIETLHAQNVCYAEITLSVGVILWKEQDFESIWRALRKTALNSPVTVRWVFDAIRHFGPEPAARVAELGIREAANGVVGFGIGGDEVRGPADWFKDLFKVTKAAGLGAVPHAGEMDGPHSIWAALELGADRIGHGFRAIEDPDLVRHLADRQIPLEICVSSNVATKAVPSLAEHPLRRLFDAGLRLVLNTDDPALFGTSLTEEYEIASRHFGFTPEELQRLAADSLICRLPEVSP